MKLYRGDYHVTLYADANTKAEAHAILDQAFRAVQPDARGMTVHIGSVTANTDAQANEALAALIVRKAWHEDQITRIKVQEARIRMHNRVGTPRRERP